MTSTALNASVEGPMAPKSDSADDRSEALFWYLRLLIENKNREGMTSAEFARRTGIEKAQVSQIQNGRPGGGVLTLLRASKLDVRTPGKILDDALSWWDGEGRGYKARCLAEKAQAAASAAEAGPSSGGSREVARIAPDDAVTRPIGAADYSKVEGALPKRKRGQARNKPVRSGK